ncbi:DUF6197 family protein [Streptomyces daghestanicus]|jgi:hypothetical protein|uniref:Uncharacterized protein n=1 Tax=Streptomyces daghestanicus TaxID=66885 RepID=A0ABQ3Q7J6_9ACTN|nr:hypothetical protein [Streptomyces daghestanicus]GGU66517.1 hypothetical protein GCM10010259_66010 [Streptomyces daghestanicus]GHI33215.1 hypothetical protein Sdagh_49450 [Streptomyces daghestanicus]
MAASLPTAPAATGRTPPAASPAAGDRLSLDARLAAAEAAMTVRLDEAAVAHEVRTAHIHTEPVDLADVITVPLTPALQPPARQLPATPVAALLERARARMETDGWCAGALSDTSGAVCLLGAIRKEAGGDHALEADAAAVVLDAIRRRFGDHVESVPSFNDAHRTGRVPIHVLGEATSMADARGL